MNISILSVSLGGAGVPLVILIKGLAFRNSYSEVAEVLPAETGVLGKGSEIREDFFKPFVKIKIFFCVINP